jgi:peptidoglycan hydrolase-like protein with peptidoglycan-binding domain
MKILGSIIVLSSLLLLAGCVTQEETSEIKTQLATLQDALSQEGQRITELELKIESISSEIQSLKPPVVVEVPKMTTEQITKIQLALTTAGFDAGKADGKMGPQTIQALKKFQEANGLKADGVIGKETWEKLQGYSNVIQ